MYVAHFLLELLERVLADDLGVAEPTSGRLHPAQLVDLLLDYSRIYSKNISQIQSKIVCLLLTLLNNNGKKWLSTALEYICSLIILSANSNNKNKDKMSINSWKQQKNRDQRQVKRQAYISCK